MMKINILKLIETSKIILVVTLSLNYTFSTGHEREDAFKLLAGTLTAFLIDLGKKAQESKPKKIKK